jgi:hypothetical protein
MIRKSRYRKALKMRLKKDTGAVTKYRTPLDNATHPGSSKDDEDRGGEARGDKNKGA